MVVADSEVVRTKRQHQFGCPICKLILAPQLSSLEMVPGGSTYALAGLKVNLLVGKRIAVSKTNPSKSQRPSLETELGEAEAMIWSRSCVGGPNSGPSCIDAWVYFRERRDLQSHAF